MSARGLERAETLFGAAAAAVVVVDPSGEAVYVNPAFERMLGLHLADLPKRRWPFLAGDDEQAFGAFLGRAFEGPAAEPFEAPARCAGGLSRPVRWTPLLLDGEPQERRVAALGLAGPPLDFGAVVRQFRAIFDEAAIGMLVIDGAMTVLANRGFEQLTGYSKAEVEGRLSWHALVHDQGDLARLKEYARLRALDPRLAPSSYEARLRTRAGEPFDVSVHVTIIPGTPYRLVLLQDITEKKRAEEGIRQSEEQYRTLVNNLQDTLYRTDAEGRLTFISPSGARLLGEDAPEAMVGRSLDDWYLSPAGREKFLRDLAATGQVTGYEVALKRRDGTPVTVLTNSHLLRDRAGRGAGVEGVFSDITERKRSEDELRKLAAILRHSSELVSLADLSGRVVFINETGLRMLGLESAQLSGLSVLEVVSPLHRDLVQNELLPTIRGGAPWEGDLQYLNRQTGRTIDTRALAFAIDSPDAQGGRYLANVSVDVSHRRQAEELSRQTQEKFLKTFTVAPDGIAITRLADGRFVDVNPAFEEMTGWKRAELDGRTSREIGFWVDPDDRAAMVAELSAGRDVLHRETRFRRKDGAVRVGSYSAKSIDVGGAEHLVYILQDVTVLKATEQTLRESKARLEAITNNIPGSLFQFYARDDGGFGLSYVNDRIAEVFGLTSRTESLFEAVVARIHPEDRARFLGSIREAVQSFSSWDFEGRLITTTEEVLWFNGRATPTRLGDRLVFDGILLDITDRKLAEEALRKSEQLFRGIIENALDVIFAITPEGAFTYLSPTWPDVMGEPAIHAIGQPFVRYVHPDDSLVFLEMLEQLRGQGKPAKNVELRGRRRDGAVRWLSLATSALRDEAGTVTGFMGTARDVTEQKRLEEERRKLEQQLFQSQKMDAIGQLAGGLAHDFNNILTGIQGNASLMQLDLAAEHPHFQRLQAIEQQVRRGANLTRQLLGFARGGKYEVKTLSLNDLLQKSAQVFIETHKDIVVEFALAEGVHPVDADAGQLEQVLLNLYLNAGHAMPKGGRLHIQTANTVLEADDARSWGARPGPYAKISVSDTGTGMDRETLKRVFEPFFTTRIKEGGTGMGLASAYGIVRNHGGVINVYSEPGRGSTFNIYLPASGAQVAPEERARERGPRAGSGSILLVDDEPMILRTASEMLKRLGYTVVEASNSAEAVAAYSAQREQIDLVILDMILPGTSGAQVLGLLKELNPAVKVVLSSGYGLQGEVRKVMEAGCLAFIQKPYRMAELSEVLHELLRARPKA